MPMCCKVQKITKINQYSLIKYKIMDLFYRSGHRDEIMSRRKQFIRILSISSLSFFFCCIVMFAENSQPQQQITVTGIVTDANNETLPGVTVMIKGTTQGTATDANGAYSLTVAEGNAILQFSYVGFVPQEHTVGNRRNINVMLLDDTQQMDEVVVVGYGTKRRSDITTAVSVVDMNNIGNIPRMDASRLLVGQAAGVVVKQTSGTPGQEMEITVRGISSLGAGSSPLFVVDGFPMGTTGQQSLNPDDIESISILKDAASTSIYGARGSNGVILITTKKAKDGELKLTASANYGIQNIPRNRRVEMMNGEEFAQFRKESFIDKYIMSNKREPTIEEIPINFRFPEQTQYNTDWFDEIANNNAAFQNYNITMSGGRGNVKSVLSIGYLKQEGPVIKTDFERFNVRANINGQLNKYISIGWNLTASRSNENMVDSNGRDNIIGFSLWADPREPVYKEDGTWNAYLGGHDDLFGAANPVMYLHQIYKLQNQNRVISNGYVEITFLKDFKFKPSINVSLFNRARTDFTPSTLAGQNAPPPRNASMTQWSRNVINYNADLLLTYAKKIGDHSIDAMLGYTAQEEKMNELRGNGSRFPNDEIRILQNAQTISITNSMYEWSILAYFARVDYNFMNKYLLSASFRREGCSRFGADNKWGDFPSLSLGWRLSEESFMPELPWLNVLKLRASYGLTGNNEIGNYPSLAGMNSANYILGGAYAPGVVLQSFANAHLGWEKAKSLDLGLDLAMFHNKLVFTAEYYDKLTTSMLLSKDIPIITGFSSTVTNVGEVRNRGVELSLDYKTSVTRDLNFRSNFNITFNRNKVMAIRGENDYIETFNMYNFYNRSEVGRPMSMLYGYKMLGIFNTEEEIANWPTQEGAIPGVYKYWDANGDGEISYDQADMVEIGNPHPKFVWGLTLAGDYKNFDLNILFNGAYGYDLYRNIESTTTNMDGIFNVLKDAKNRWRSAENPGNGKIPTTNTWKWEREVNSRYVYDASHAWVKSITLGYTLPYKSSILQGSRFYVNVENLFLITKYPGNNPDVNTNNNINIGRDDEAYPVPRIFTIGTTITF